MTARALALPCWTGPPRVSALTGGLSNEICRVTDQAGDWVVRFGADYPFHQVSRDREAMVARAAAALGFGPEVRFAKGGAFVTRFVAGRTWAPADVCANPERLGRLLRSFHGRMGAAVSGPAYLFWPFHVVRGYLRELAGAGPGGERRGASPPDPPGYLQKDEEGTGQDGLAGWSALNAALEARQPPLPLIFGHHDLLPANLIDDGARLWLIDYEYAGFGTCLFDLAGAASNAGMDRDQALALIRAYLGRPPSARFLRAFDGMQVASLLREMLWARVSARHLKAPGVDYAAYAAENEGRLLSALEEYQTMHGRLT